MITLVVPSFNRNNDLERCLRSIRERSTTDIEIIVPHPEADSGLEQICSKYSAVHYLDRSRNGGKRVKSLWCIINEAIDRASCDLVGWLNDDCEVIRGWDTSVRNKMAPKTPLVVLRTRNTHADSGYGFVASRFGIYTACYGVLDKKTGIRFDSEYSWFYGDADLSLELEIKRHFRVVGADEPCVDHHHVEDGNRRTNENDPRAREDEARFKKKWGSYFKFRGRYFEAFSPRLARIAQRLVGDQ